MRSNDLRKVTRQVQWSVAFTLSALLAGACKPSPGKHSTPGGSAGAGGSGGGAGGGGTGGSGGTGGGNGPVPSNGDPISVIHGVATKLPALPELTNVGGNVVDDLVQVDFDPVDGAADYRIYALPDDANISISNGAVTVANATYRCAGQKETSVVVADDGSPNPYVTAHAYTNVQSNIEGYTRTMAEATLGWVYATGGDGRTPVWGLSSPDAKQGSVEHCDEAGWFESRIKTYTASQSEHDQLVQAGWRDDGIRFYAPTTASGTTPLYSATVNGDPLYFVSAGELAARQSANPAKTNFVVLTAAQPDAQPLMRVHYTTLCSMAGVHDELVIGKTRFAAAYHQGPVPLSHVVYAGVAKPTVLVVEALSGGCPYQGMLSATHFPAFTDATGAVMSGSVSHEEYVTVAEMRAASPSGEVFINGQSDTATRPQAIARSFVQVNPPAPPTFDFFDGFHDDETLSFGPRVEIPTTAYARGSSYRMSGDRYDLSMYEIQPYDQNTLLLGAGNFLGQFWLTYSDLAQDVNGKVRLEPKQAAQLAADSFVHVTMSVDSVATRRRYPQIIVSDQPRPVQETMANGHAVIVEPILGWPTTLQIQLCDHQMWDVNAQCQFYELIHSDDSIAESMTPLPPVVHMPDHTGVDRSNQYDVYVSTARVYVFFDGQPYGCANLPAGKLQAGAAQVSFGDVLYHTAADIAGTSDFQTTYPFHLRHLEWETRRHFDNLGFSSGVPAPTWNEQLIPCRDQLKMPS